MNTAAAARDHDGVRARLERLLGGDAVTSAAGSAAALGALPLASPGDVDELCEALRLAHRDGLRVLPIGAGSKLAWSRAPEGADFALSTRRLSGVVAYEPGDGTLTALAGSSMDALSRTAEAGGHQLTPAVPAPETATLGGVLGAGQSGIDRTRHGPARHHVLGMQVALADGTLARTGGRLVKNVTGFDLQRLYCGSHGTLCVIVEATLRLFAAPDAWLVLRRRTEDARAAVREALALRRLPVRPWAVVVDHEPGVSTELDVVLAGGEESVRWEEEQARAALGSDFDVLRGPEARGRIDHLRERGLEQGSWPDVRATCLPSALEPALERLTRRATRVRAEPYVARLDAWLGERARPLPRGVEQLAPADGAPAIPAAAVALMQRLRAALDPSGVFARRIQPGEVSAPLAPP